MLNLHCRFPVRSLLHNMCNLHCITVCITYYIICYKLIIFLNRDLYKFFYILFIYVIVPYCYVFFSLSEYRLMKYILSHIFNNMLK